MSELLDNVLAAHGGSERWARVSGLIVEGSLGGPFWAAKGWFGVYEDVTITVDARRFCIDFEPYPTAGRRSHLEAGPERLEIRSADGAVIEGRDRPRESFPPTDPSPKWDAIQTAYFTSCACWNYFTAPFLFTYSGVGTEEIEPWEEEGETWRRLAVTFPPELPNHNREQTFYFDQHFLLRRMDYHPDVTDSPIAHYCYDHRTFDGFVFPTRRRIHVHDAAGHADKEFTPITIDLRSVRVLADDD